MSYSLTYRSVVWLGRTLANILPTDFGLQEPADTAKPALRIAKVLVSGLWRRSRHIAKVRVAGSSPVVRSRKAW
jgi:hypothetical protein